MANKFKKQLGVFQYKDEKLSKKERKAKERKEKMKAARKAFKKKNKELEMQSLCDHYSKNDHKRRIKAIRNDQGEIIKHKCKICGQDLYFDPRHLSKENVKYCADVIATVFGLTRASKDINIGKDMNRMIATTIKMNGKAPDISGKLKEFGTTKQNKKGKKKKKKNKTKPFRKNVLGF